MPSRRLLSLLAMPLVAQACNDVHAGRPAEARLLAPTRVDFPRAFLGYPVQAPLELVNGGLAKLELTIDVPPPFVANETRVELDGGKSLVVVLRFEPVAPGRVEAIARLADDDTAHEVQLVATAEVPPDCRPRGSCYGVEFNPLSGTCEDRPRANGSWCAEICLADGRCNDGVCVGLPLSCDDGNPCTRDSCNPVTGCVNDDTVHGCPAPEDPCRVATCNPHGGCGSEQAPDGTTCGPLDCETAHLCFLGRCRALPTPDGVPCWAPGACSGMGECRSHQCVETMSSPRPAWAYTPTANHELWFPGIVDDAGNHYWLEYGGPWRAELVSVDRDGATRYRRRVDIHEREWAGTHRAMALVGDLLVLGISAERVEARRAVDGSLAWSRNLREAAASEASLAFPPWSHSLHGSLIAASDRDRIVVRVDVINQYPCDDCFEPAPTSRFLVSFDAAGTVRWLEPVDVPGASNAGDCGECVDALVAAPDGHLFYGPASVVFSPAGLRRRGAGYMPEAVSDSTLLAHDICGSSFDCRSLSNFATPERQVPVPRLAQPLMQGGRLYGITKTGTPTLVALDTATAQLRWEVPLEGLAPVLTNRGSVLVLEQTRDRQRLREFDLLHGLPLMSCDLPKDVFSGPVTLSAGRWAMIVEKTEPVTHRVVRTVRAFEVSDLTTATQGWVVDGGNMGRSHRPR